MKGIDSLKRELWIWKQLRKKNLKWLKIEVDLPPNLRNENGIKYIYWKLDRIETAIWQVKTRLEEFA